MISPGTKCREQKTVPPAGVSLTESLIHYAKSGHAIQPAAALRLEQYSGYVFCVAFRISRTVEPQSRQGIGFVGRIPQKEERENRANLSASTR